MTKVQLTKNVAEAAKITEAQAKEAVDACFEAITQALINREDVRIHKFGTFVAEHKAPRKAHNPSTGEKIMTEDKHVAKFKVAESLALKVK